MNVTARIKRYWGYLIGRDAGFTLEGRIYNAVCILGLAGILYNIPFNFIAGLPVSGIVSIFLLLVLSYFYYLSRFSKKVTTSFLAAVPLINLLLLINFFFNSGINGPTLILLALIFFLTMAVTPPKLFLFWAALNICMIFCLLYIQYQFPEWVPYTYSDRLSRFVDTGSAYIVMTILIYTGVLYIRIAYDKEKSKAEARTSEMEHLDKQKNKLFTIVSHDLRMPLATVQHYLEVLTEVKLPSQEKQRFENELLQITRNTQDMLSNLLFWSKTQMEGQGINLTEINVSEALKKVIDVQAAAAIRKGIELQYHFKKEADSLTVRADDDMLQLTFRNIISNAIKFTPVGKTIRIRLEEQKNDCLISIEDKGCGIPAERQKNIFSLNAVSTYGTENEKGVGLGLVLCKEFISAQNGEIWFKSEPGSGTTFYISIPTLSRKQLETIH